MYLRSMIHYRMKACHDSCRKLRRTRRNRLRYRKPRFDNRKRGEGWLAPSLKHKKELNVNVVKMYCTVMPITHATVEVGSFDTMLVKAIQEGKVIPEGSRLSKRSSLQFGNLAGSGILPR